MDAQVLNLDAQDLLRTFAQSSPDVPARKNANLHKSLVMIKRIGSATRAKHMQTFQENRSMVFCGQRYSPGTVSFSFWPPLNGVWDVELEALGLLGLPAPFGILEWQLFIHESSGPQPCLKGKVRLDTSGRTILRIPNLPNSGYGLLQTQLSRLSMQLAATGADSASPSAWIGWDP